MVGITQNRTLFLAFYAAFPPTGGASTVTYQLARHWPGERILVQIGALAAHEEPAPGMKVITLSYGGRGERWQKLTQVPRWVSQMTAIAEDYQPNRIILEGASWVAYHWRLVSALRRRVADATLIYHAHNVEYDLRRQKHSRAVAELTRWLERRVLAGVDIATAVSPTDALRFRALYGIETVSLPNGVDVAWLRGASEVSVETLGSRRKLTPETVLFMGSYGYRPNREAIDFLVADVFPVLMRRRPDARLLILGGAIPYERPWLIAPGLVPWDDLPGYIKAAAVSVAPIFTGSGTRLKILESLAVGTPVVTTAKGMEGLPLEHGVDVIRAETADAFVDALADVLNNPAKARRRFESGMAKVVAAFDWRYLVRQFNCEFLDHSGGPQGCVDRRSGRG